MRFNIEAERVRNKMSKEELSEKMNISLKTYYNWLNESTDISGTKLLEMGKLFGVSMEYLLTSVPDERGMTKKNLKDVKTCELVAELGKRVGVEKVQAEPYQKKEISVKGPAVILIVTD